MLRKLTKEISKCYRHAEEARRTANAAADPGIRADFLDIERRWLFLARSYEFAERLSDFTGEAKRRLRNRD